MPGFAFLALLLAVGSASAEPRLFLPVFSEPLPAQIERELRILSAASGESKGAFLTRRAVMATAMDEGGRRLFMGIGEGSVEKPGCLAVYSVATGRLQTVGIPISFPNAIALDEPNGRLFVGSNVDHRIAEVDLVSLQVVNLIELSGSAGGVGSSIAVDPNRGRLHLIRADALEVIDLATSSVIQRIDMQPMTAVPSVQRFDAIRGRLYFSNFNRLEVFDVTDTGLMPYATVQFDRTLRSLFLDEQGARLYAGATGAGGADEGTYAIGIDSIPPGASGSSAVDTRFLSLPRRAPYMDLDRQAGILYLVQDYHVTPHLPPRPPGDPMKIFAVDARTLEIQRTIETTIGGPLVPVDRFLTRVAGPDGVMAASVPTLQGVGLTLLLIFTILIGLKAVRWRASG